MANPSGCCNSLLSTSNPALVLSHSHNKLIQSSSGTSSERRQTPVFAAKSGGFSLNSILKRCETCSGKGAIECPGCKGTGKNKKNGNIFERWKCFDCQGFGLRSCPNCGKGGLTPEQRGER
ncbi:Heat shock protein DnaJ, cysteine-rich domain containing protein [Parasponia andersonii]|uniref:Heat shock protein DnaJ, cysteine-rich domain containing protein n=1 Tax=Parasponia andersonii TaxID=3476 RepID=A0A2P5BLM2_PARAD|nr:Heat shock protein DnaJ, cysteine-rich domain containing protein [Parasponia andersonii]